MSTVGFIILAHERFDRVATVADTLIKRGPVVIHVDAAVGSLPRGMAEGVSVFSAHRTEWGMMGLVDATLDALSRMRTAEGTLPDHVCLLSGSCLPIRPVTELVAFLSRYPEHEFIEAVPADGDGWVQGGLSAERFRYWFPFSWRRQRWLFDRAVDFQRWLGVRRRVPEGLTPHIGLQWWALRGATLTAILDHPDLPRWRRFFRRCWIPDECFFQTIVPALTDGKLRGFPLTLQRFDPDGRPYVFHDDHTALLLGAGYFFARKVDPDADGLYRRFPAPPVERNAPAPATVDEGPFERARARTLHGPGIAVPGRVVAGSRAVWTESPQPYMAVIGSDAAVLQAARAALAAAGVTAHGHLFHTGAPELAESACKLGNLPMTAEMTAYRPVQFLARLIWAMGQNRMAFLFSPDAVPDAAAFLAADENARLVLLEPAAPLIGRLRNPWPPRPRKRLRLRKPKPRKPMEVWSWHVDLSDLAHHPEALAKRLTSLAQSDWTDPHGWQVPDGARRRAYARVPET